MNGPFSDHIGVQTFDHRNGKVTVNIYVNNTVYKSLKLDGPVSIANAMMIAMVELRRCEQIT